MSDLKKTKKIQRKLEGEFLYIYKENVIDDVNAGVD